MRNLLPKNEKGITLTEIILSLALLGVVALPLNSLYTSTLLTNRYANSRLDASLRLQSYAESILAAPIALLLSGGLADETQPDYALAFTPPTDADERCVYEQNGVVITLTPLKNADGTLKYPKTTETASDGGQKMSDLSLLADPLDMTGETGDGTLTITASDGVFALQFDRQGRGKRRELPETAAVCDIALLVDHHSADNTLTVINETENAVRLFIANYAYNSGGERDLSSKGLYYANADAPYVVVQTGGVQVVNEIANTTTEQARVFAQNGGAQTSAAYTVQITVESERGAQTESFLKIEI